MMISEYTGRLSFGWVRPGQATLLPGYTQTSPWPAVLARGHEPPDPTVPGVGLGA
jgi:hypothetical protein